MMAFDRVEKLGASTVQHGSGNDRVYLMMLDPADLPEIFEKLDALVAEGGYTKIFAKVPGRFASDFTSAGFVEEARIPGLFNGREDGVFLCKYFDPRRELEIAADTIAKNLALAEARRDAGHGAGRGPAILSLRAGHADEMAAIYRAVFGSYPFPIYDPAYLRRTMGTHIAYFGIAEQSRLVALASSETSRDAENVEMTDFATLPSHLGRGYAVHLLRHMEDAMRGEGIKTAFTLARAMSAGMNITFAKLGYDFAGTLTNNTNISGAIESMNVWSKAL